MQIDVQLFDGPVLSVPLGLGLPVRTLREIDGALTFDIPEGERVYLSSGGHIDFARPPEQTALALNPDTTYLLSGKVTAEGGEVRLWLIEYDETTRLAHQMLTLQSGPLDLAWRTHPRHRACCLALRLMGRGRLVLSRLVLQQRVGVPADEPDMSVDLPGVQPPSPTRVEGFADAHQYMGVTRSADPLLPDLSPEDMQARLDRHEIGHALVMPCGATRTLDTYDQICELAAKLPGRICPLYRYRNIDTRGDGKHEFELRQLELLWQDGLLFGLKVRMGTDDLPPEPVLDWVERRQLLTMWRASCMKDLEWLETNILSRHAFPVLLSHFGGYPLDPKRYDRAVDMLSRYPHLYLVTGGVWSRGHLTRAIERHPHQVLMGSDSPAVDPTAARGVIAGLDVAEDHKTLVLAKNLRFLIERVERHRRGALERNVDLLFPKLPRTRDELRAQGFLVTEPTALPPNEAEVARRFWSEQAVQAWYEADHPWRRLVATMVRDLEPRSVLEFGCNVGQNLLMISQIAPCARLVGIDINAGAVRVGRERTGLDLREGDDQQLKAFEDGEFDLVFTVSVLDHISSVHEVCRELVRIAAKYAYFLEVRLPVEGRVVQRFDHCRRTVCRTIDVSYSWHLERYVRGSPRLWRLDGRPCYLHPSGLGPYYHAYMAFLDAPDGR